MSYLVIAGTADLLKCSPDLHGDHRLNYVLDAKAHSVFICDCLLLTLSLLIKAHTIFTNRMILRSILIQYPERELAMY